MSKANNTNNPAKANIRIINKIIVVSSDHSKSKKKPNLLIIIRPKKLITANKNKCHFGKEYKCAKYSIIVIVFN